MAPVPSYKLIRRVECVQYCWRLVQSGYSRLLVSEGRKSLGLSNNNSEAGSKMEQTKHELPQPMEGSDKEVRIKRCYEYMQSLKAALSAEEFAQYLQYLKLLKANYVSDKIQFYATVAFQIFFPPEQRQSSEAVAVRRDLFLQSKSFYPRGPDRDRYHQECMELIRQRFEQPSKPLANITNQKPQQEIDDKTKADMTCMICMEPYEQYKDFYKAKCGHVACGHCWFTWLASCLECPMCKQRTRTKQLIKIQQCPPSLQILHNVILLLSLSCATRTRQIAQNECVNSCSSCLGKSPKQQDTLYLPERLSIPSPALHSKKTLFIF